MKKLKGGGGGGGAAAMRRGGMARDVRSDLHRPLEVCIERRMSDVQRARHVGKSRGVVRGETRGSK